VIDEILFEAEEKMEKAGQVAREDFATLRTGRANPAMFNKIAIDYYGTKTPLNQIASFQTPEALMILIAPYDKSSMGDIERAIRDSNLGVNPTNDGTIIRVVLPALTEERRREYVKVARTKAEDAKIAIRNIRRGANTHLEKLMRDGEAGEDEVRRAEKQLDDVTGKQVAHVDDILKHKEAELLEV
jgi:ribosome recycling factor